MASDKLQGKRIAFLVAPEGTEQVELTEPWKAVEGEGGTPELLSTDSGEIQAFNHLDKADTFTVDRTVSEADASDYDGLVLPGGVANPDFLRMDEDAVAFVREFFEQAKPVAAICHGPWTLIEADVVQRPQDHLVAVAADRPAQRGRQLGRRGGRRRRGPRDLPQARRPQAFCAKAVEELCEGEHAEQARSVVAGRPSRRRSWTSTGRSSTRTTSTRSRGTGRSASTAWCCRSGASTATSGWAATSWSPPSSGEEFDAEHGDDVRAAEKALYMSLIVEVEPLEGARELIADLRESGPRRGARLLRQAGRGRPLPRAARRARRSSTAGRPRPTSRRTKPEPDLVAAAVEKAGGGKAVMVGDSTWDCESAKRAGVKTVGVLTGGFSEQELLDAGATCVFDSLVALRRDLAQTPLGIAAGRESRRRGPVGCVRRKRPPA